METDYEKIEEGMFVFDENVPFRQLIQALTNRGYKGVSITQTELHKKKDIRIIEELKKIKDIIFVTCDNGMYWLCTMSKVPCIYLSIEGALLDVFIRNIKLTEQRLSSAKPKGGEVK